MALVLPLFLLFLFGLIEIGRGFMTTHILTNAARTACRESIAQNKTNSEVKATVSALLDKSGYEGYTTTISVNGAAGEASTAQSEQEISVVVSIPVAKVTWLPVARFLTGSLSGQCSLRRE